MKELIFKTQNNWVGLIARFTIGFIMLPHGIQKIFGIWGGFGFKATMSFFTDTMHIPWIISFLIILIEFLGSVCLIIGLGSRIWSACMIILMIGIILTSHLDNGFFMNWFGNQKGEGFEYHLLMIGIAFISFINGSGKYSFDQLWFQTTKNPLK